MKKFLILLLFYGITVPQIFSQAPDFTMTDVDGNAYNLYEELSKEKPILLAFFSTACGSCQYAVPTLDSLWNDLFQQGEEGWLWAFESSLVGDEMVIKFLDDYGGTYPGFSTRYDDSVLTQDYGYSIDYTPKYFMVCPDSSYKEIPLNQVGEAYYGCIDTIPEDTISGIITNQRIQNGLFYYHNSQITLEPKNIQNGVYLVDIIDIAGNLVTRKELSLTGSDGKAILNVHLKNGLYVILLRDNGSVVSAGKVMVY